MLKCISLTLIAFGLVTSGLWADTVLDCADSFFTDEMWDAALTEYKRFVFFNPDNHERHRCYHRIAQCYARMGEYKGALDVLTVAAKAAPDDSVRQLRRIEASVVLKDMGSLTTAELGLARVVAFSQDEHFTKSAALLLAECQLGDFRWQGAKATLARSGILSAGPQGAGLDSMFSDIERQSLKSSDLALQLSTFVPGLGQAYAGSPLRGLHALVLNALFAYIIVDSFLDKDLGNGAGTMGFAIRYYMGNRANAVNLATEYNQRILSEGIDRIISRIHLIQKTGDYATWDP